MEDVSDRPRLGMDIKDSHGEEQVHANIEDDV